MGGVFRRSVVTAVIVASLVAIQRDRGLASDAPFIAGFDRFARHGELEPVVAGRLLVTELGCTACHVGKEAFPPKPGPKLNGVGDRVRADWLRRFLANPSATKPGTTMPNLLATLDDAQRTRVVDSLAAFLATQRSQFVEPKASGASPVPHEFWSKGDPDAGRRLYHQIGCVACHDPDNDYLTDSNSSSALDRLLEQLDADEIKELGLSAAARPIRSVPLGDVPAKYTLQSLTYFLLDPESVRPGGRMPSFKLSPTEAADVAAFLLRRGVDQRDSPAQKVSTRGLAVPAPSQTVLTPEQEAGRKFFAEFKCSACHELTGWTPAPPAKPLDEINSDSVASCMGAPRAGLPQFALDPLQVESIRAALTALRQAKTLSVEHALELRLLQLDCYACHERSRRGGVGRKRQSYFQIVGNVDLGDEGRMPPPLDHVGRKLRLAWMKKVFDGTGIVRPYMLARMPVFPNSSTAALPGLLAKADNAAPPADPASDTRVNDLIETGRRLLDTGCVDCHPVRGDRLPGAVGVDLASTATRIRTEWFRAFLLNPNQLKPRTRMPTFFPNGKSANKELLGGNVDQQITAIWSYLGDVGNQPLPDKIEHARAMNLELVPNERPILLRTFMEQAGTHAIAVGFPARVHFAFDAELVRPAVAWRGRFLDAQSTWFDRFTPPAVPLGENVVELPAGVPFAQLDLANDRWPNNGDNSNRYQFTGYRLDPEGIPTFLYRFGAFEVEDRMAPEGNTGLKRRLRIQSHGAGLTEPTWVWFLAHAGTNLERRSPSSYGSDQGLGVEIPEPLARDSSLRTSRGRVEWLIKINVANGETIEVDYRW